LKQLLEILRGLHSLRCCHLLPYSPRKDAASPSSSVRLHVTVQRAALHIGGADAPRLLHSSMINHMPLASRRTEIHSALGRGSPTIALEQTWSVERPACGQSLRARSSAHRRYHSTVSPASTTAWGNISVAICLRRHQVAPSKVLKLPPARPIIVVYSVVFHSRAPHKPAGALS
jgi:hypothetical protein